MTMTDLAKASFGVQLHLAAYNVSPTYNLIGEVESLNLPELMRDVIDATTHDSANGAAEYIAEGTYNTGTIKGTLNLIAGDTDQTAIMDAIRNGTRQSIKIVFDGYQLLGSGFVTKFTPDANGIKGKKTASFEIQPNADWTLTAVS